jgi:hypothetical protein
MEQKRIKMVVFGIICLTQVLWAESPPQANHESSGIDASALSAGQSAEDEGNFAFIDPEKYWRDEESIHGPIPHKVLAALKKFQQNYVRPAYIARRAEFDAFNEAHPEEVGLDIEPCYASDTFVLFDLQARIDIWQAALRSILKEYISETNAESERRRMVKRLALDARSGWVQNRLESWIQEHPRIPGELRLVLEEVLGVLKMDTGLKKENARGGADHGKRTLALKEQRNDKASNALSLLQSYLPGTFVPDRIIGREVTKLKLLRSMISDLRELLSEVRMRPAGLSPQLSGWYIGREAIYLGGGVEKLLVRLVETAKTLLILPTSGRIAQDLFTVCDGIRNLIRDGEEKLFNDEDWPEFAENILATLARAAGDIGVVEERIDLAVKEAGIDLSVDDADVLLTRKMRYQVPVATETGLP